MKKLLMLVLSVTLIFCFSTVAFAMPVNNFRVEEETEAETEIIAYEDDAVSESFEEMGLEKSTTFLFALAGVSILLWIPTLILLIVLNSQKKKLKEKINVFEAVYGEVYTKEIMNDMKDIPPSNYNFNPQTFAPFSPEENKNSNYSQLETNFNETLNSQIENNDWGNK